MPPEEQTQQPEVQVDKGAITRQSVLDGAWAGMKKGLMWGGIGALGLAGAGTMFGMMGVKMAAGSVPMLAAIPVVGPWIAGALGLGAAGGVAAIAAAGPVGIAWQLLSTALLVAVKVGVPILAAGALIGGVIGAIKGYSAAEEKVELAERQARRQARQQQAQVAQARAQQQELENKVGAFNQQTQDIASGNIQLGQFSPDSTPNSLDNNGLGGNMTPQGGKV